MNEQRWATTKTLTQKVLLHLVHKSITACVSWPHLSPSTDILFSTHMPPKREAGATPAQPPIKMIKIGGDTQEFGCDPTEDRMAEESSFSPFPTNEVREFVWNVHKEKKQTNNQTQLLYTRGNCSCDFFFFFSQHEHIEFDEEHVSSPGIRTDTISLLMKIEQLQAQLKYERRCRILAERELRELKGGWNKMMNTLNYYTENIFFKKHLSWPHSLITVCDSL